MCKTKHIQRPQLLTLSIYIYIWLTLNYNSANSSAARVEFNCPVFESGNWSILPVIDRLSLGVESEQSCQTAAELLAAEL